MEFAVAFVDVTADTVDTGFLVVDTVVGYDVAVAFEAARVTDMNADAVIVFAALGPESIVDIAAGE